MLGFVLTHTRPVNCFILSLISVFVSPKVKIVFLIGKAKDLSSCTCPITNLLQQICFYFNLIIVPGPQVLHTSKHVSSSKWCITSKLHFKCLLVHSFSTEYQSHVRMLCSLCTIITSFKYLHKAQPLIISFIAVI